MSFSSCVRRAGRVCGWMDANVGSASSLGMMSEEERKVQRIEDIKELLS